jgi:hypothetical protein
MSEQVQEVVEQVVEQAQTEQKPQEIEAKEPEKQQDDFSTKFAALSRREKQLLERERKLKAMEEEITGKSSKLSQWEERKKLFKENPDELFNEIGLSFEDIVNKKLGIEPEEKQLTPDEVYKKLQAELESKFKKLEEEKQKQIEEENAQILSNFKNDIESYLTKNADKYELINYQKDFDLVFDVVQEYFDQNGEVLSIEVAADHVEKHLEDLVSGATKLKKIASKFAPKIENQPDLKSAIETDKAKDKKVAPTLSNELNSRSSTTKGPAISLEESKKNAARLLRWNN